MTTTIDDLDINEAALTLMRWGLDGITVNATSNSILAELIETAGLPRPTELEQFGALRRAIKRTEQRHTALVHAMRRKAQR